MHENVQKLMIEDRAMMAKIDQAFATKLGAGDANKQHGKWAPTGKTVVDWTWPPFPPKQQRAIICVQCDQLAVVPAAWMDDLCPGCTTIGADQLAGITFDDELDEAPAPAGKFVPKYLRDQQTRARTCPSCGIKSTRPVCSCRPGRTRSTQAPGAPAMRVGATVMAGDRDNYGTVLKFTTSTATIMFVNNERGTVAKVELPRHLLTVVR